MNKEITDRRQCIIELAQGKTLQTVDGNTLWKLDLDGRFWSKEGSKEGNEDWKMSNWNYVGNYTRFIIHTQMK